MLQIRNFALEDWQEQAVDLWAAGDGVGLHRGTLEIFTGGGKTLIALSCAARAAMLDPDLKLAVVVPTQALARQWIEAIVRFTNIPRDAIGLLGAGGKDSLSSRQVLVCVLNTAAVRLPRMAAEVSPVMLIIDECHRAGADTFRRVLETPAKYRLGLSATPERDDFDSEGEPVRYDEQAVARGIGRLVYSFGLKEAREIGWLPPYEIHHHGVLLSDTEREQYEALTRQVDDLAKKLQAMGVETWRSRRLSIRSDDLGRIARAYVATTSKRKDLLYRCHARNRVAARLVLEAMGESEGHRVLLFHERVSEATALYRTLLRAIPDRDLALEHSKLPEQERRRSLERFRVGDARVLVSVKSLVEGIDVPEADVGISVASSSSVRQRIQSLGRVLRRSFVNEGPTKRAFMHVLYVRDTVDEQIYAKEDWSDITGPTNNLYWHWSPGEDPQKSPEAGPPREPRASEETIWESFGRAMPEVPMAWAGSLVGQEYSVDTLGNVTNSSGLSISNPQAVGRIVELVRGRPGGRFRVTPKYRFVLVSQSDGESSKWYAGGRLDEPFTGDSSSMNPGAASTQPERPLQSGDPFDGPLDASRGTYRLRQKSGGVIERRGMRGSVEWAIATNDAPSVLAENARNVLSAWRSVVAQGMEFYVNDSWMAWYRQDGQAKFLATVPDGFSWPSPLITKTGEE